MNIYRETQGIKQGRLVPVCDQCGFPINEMEYVEIEEILEDHNRSFHMTCAVDIRDALNDAINGKGL